MRRILITAIAILSFGTSISASAQSIRKKPVGKKAPVGRGHTPPCDLMEAPKLRGFYLGQTVTEIENAIPNFRGAYELQKANRNTAFSLSDWRREVDPVIADEMTLVYVDSSWAFGFDSDRKLLISADHEDVKFVWWFMGEKLFAYGVYYHDLEIDQDAAKFINQVSGKTSLPVKGWKTTDVDAILQCSGFRVYLNAGYRNVPHLIITDTKVEAEIVRLEKQVRIRLQKEEKERLRRERVEKGIFKP